MSEAVLHTVRDETEWTNAYPPERRDLLRRFGVPDFMDANAAIYNRRLIELANRAHPDGAQFARELEQAFVECFGDLLHRRATKAATQASVSGVKHVDLTPTEQVSIANAIGHVIERFRNRKVSGVVGFTIDGEEVRFFSGGFLPEEVLVKGALALQAPGLPLVRARDGADPGATLAGLSSILVHTRDKAEQQRAVRGAINAVRARYRDGDVQCVFGVTIDKYGRAIPFAGGETNAQLLEQAVELLRAYLREGERRYDH